MFRCHRHAGAVLISPATLLWSVRHQASIHDLRRRATASASRTKRRPGGSGGDSLQPSNPPSARSIAVPDSVHARRGSTDALTAEALNKKVQRTLALQLKKNMLWEGSVVSSAAHDIAQHFLLLRTNRKYRSARRMLIAGGKAFIQELCDAGHAPKQLMIPAGTAIPEWVNRNHTEVVATNRNVADEVVPGTDGYVGAFETPPSPPREGLIANKQRMQRVLVLDNVEDPGTLGTMLRTAAGFAYDAVLLVNHCADLFDPRVVRAARGAHFQPCVPFYQLREEDGDDATGMIRHVMHRNNLDAVCYTPQRGNAFPQSGAMGSGAPAAAVAPAHATAGASYAPQEAQVVGSNNTSGPSVLVKKLSQFCLDSYATGDAANHARGHVLFAGPDHKPGSLIRRAARASPRPLTKLLLNDEPEHSSLPSASSTDLVASLSCVLYALRPSGDWDYLPPSRQSSPSHKALQDRTKVDLGPDRPLPIRPEDLSLTHDEQLAAGHHQNVKAREQRREKKQLTDYGFWLEAEQKRILEMAKNEFIQRVSPWRDPATPRERGADGLPPSIPNIINDYRQNLDRDVLRQESDDAKAYVRPTNYDSRIAQRPPKTRRT